jgi:hypothetical protein
MLSSAIATGQPLRKTILIGTRGWAQKSRYRYAFKICSTKHCGERIQQKPKQNTFKPNSWPSQLGVIRVVCVVVVTTHYQKL